MNTHETPSGGWQFRQVQTGWSAPTPVGSTFDQTVVLIIKHRMANPAVVAKHRLSLDTNEVGRELFNFNRLRLGLPPENPSPPQPSFFQARRNPGPAPVVAAAANIKRAAQSAAVVVDWLESGGAPVPIEIATRRASICVGCPKNVEGSWYTTAPALIIKAALEARKDLKLETPYDAQLKSCEVCRCVMRLKVWTPLEHILKGTKPEIMAEFPGWCWIARKDQ